MERGSPTGRRQHGFTVAEMLVVLLIVGLVAAIAVPNVSAGITRAQEAALRENLSVMRRSLDDYFSDTGAYPPDLETLVQRRYLRFIPDDPVSPAGTRWDVRTATDGGIVDVASSSGEPGSNDVPYNEW